MTALMEAAATLVCLRLVYFGNSGTPLLPLVALQRDAIECGDVGCVATSAKRHSASNAPGMTALMGAIEMLARRTEVAWNLQFLLDIVKAPSH